MFSRSTSRGTVALLVALLCALTAGVAAQSLEYQVKAAFLLNFTKFIDWPADAAVPSTLDICLAGGDPFGGALEQIVGGETFQGHRLQVQRVHRPIPASCRVVYFGREEKNLASALESIGPGVLTVGEGDSFLQDGGIIAFVVESNRVRFDISQRAAAKAHLMLSSKLLSVARTVER